MPSSRQPGFALLLGLAWLLVAVQLLAQYWPQTALTLGDTDDAMRLAQLRDWLGGQGWFDLHQWRVAGGYESHWSRLIDAGLAGALWIFGAFAEPAVAERLMRTAWPMVWLLPAMAATAAIAWRIAGREAALLALLMAVVGLPALHQFRPGRIDHHNVQMAFTFIVLAATVWSDRVRWAAAVAGAASGLALGIGLESLPYLMLCAVAFALRFVLDPKGAQPAARYGVALAASSAAAFLATVGPDHWSRHLCDAMAVNWLALVGAGGLALALAARFAAARMPVRLLCAALAGGGAVALAVSFEPRCLGGPYTAIDPAAWPIWLSHVSENMPLAALMTENPLTGIAIVAFPATALIGTLFLVHQREMRSDFAFLATAAAFAVAAVMTVAAIRSATYATWLGMPLVAVFALHLFVAFRLERLVPRAAVGVLLTPAVLSLGAVTIANAAGIGKDDTFHRTGSEACFKNESYATLAKLPPGTVAADIDYGPYILALTPHTVLAAPYHRLAARIIEAHELFSSSPDRARRILAQHRVTYVVTCKSRHAGRGEAQAPASFGKQLRAGAVPDWLIPVTEAQDISVYRFKA